MVGHALERVWKTISKLSQERAFCFIRHSMHFFLSNLVYYLQADVIDYEFSLLMKAISLSTDFQSVLRASRNFLASIVNLSMVDNTAIQEGIERILQVCLRFVCVCKIVQENFQPERYISDILVVPPEELQAIQKDFYTHVLYIFQIMQKVENRGFMFRLDFNGYLSQTATSLASDPNYLG